MRLSLNPRALQALIVPALALSLVAVAAPPSDVHRQQLAKPLQIASLGMERTSAPPVAGRQDGPLPPSVFP